MIDVDRLRHRKLVQWALAYLAAAWLILQLVDLLADNFAWPASVPRTTTVLLAVGFLAALVVAWYHGEKGAQRASGMEILMLAGILVVAGAAVGFLGRGPGRTVEGADAPAGAAAEQNSIAVLPFVNMSGDAKEDYFSDGLTEELLNVLAQLPELRVASRTSAFAFKGQEVGIDSIARALRVAHVLEGSVRQAGERVKITAQLIDAATGYHLWSQTYERDYQDIFAIQEEISQAIVASLKLRLPGERAGRDLMVPETSDPEAHKLVLQGMAAVRAQNEGSVRQARELFEQALTRDPDYLRARAELASVLFTLAYRGVLPVEEGYGAARREAERVLAVDPGNAEAHVVLGLVAEWQDWDWKRGEAHYRRALERNPSNAPAHTGLGWLLMRLGQSERALDEAKRAVELDPLSAQAHNALGALYIYASRYHEGIAALEKALALAPEATNVVGNLALVHALLGALPVALRYAEQARAVDSTDTFVLSTLGLIHAKAGRRAGAEQMLRLLDALPVASWMDRAAVNLALGRTDVVFEQLEKALAAREPYLADLPMDPLFQEPLGDDPRMKRLLARVVPR